MRIGKLATVAGVTITTLRFYERRGLLPPPVRQASGFRDYPDETIARVQLIKTAQSLGFSLAEIAELLRLREQRFGNAAEVRSLVQARLETIEEKMTRLAAMRQELRQLLTVCDCHAGAADCQLLTAQARKP